MTKVTRILEKRVRIATAADIFKVLKIYADFGLLARRDLILGYISLLRRWDTNEKLTVRMRR